MSMALEASVNGFLRTTRLTSYLQYACLDQPLKAYLANTSIALGESWTR